MTAQGLPRKTCSRAPGPGGARRGPHQERRVGRALPLGRLLLLVRHQAVPRAVGHAALLLRSPGPHARKRLHGARQSAAHPCRHAKQAGPAHPARLLTSYACSWARRHRAARAATPARSAKRRAAEAHACACPEGVGHESGSGEGAHHVLLRAERLLLGALDALLLLLHGQALLLHVLLDRRADRAGRVDALLVVLQQFAAGHAPARTRGICTDTYR